MDLNTVSIIGNLTKDPELKEMASGTSLANLRVAVNRIDGNGEKLVSYFDIEAWGRTAENAASYLAKGRQVAVTGELRQSRWETPEGQKRQRVYVYARSIQFLSSPQGEREAVAAGDVSEDDNIPF